MANTWREIFEFDKELVQERENGKKDMIADMLRRGKRPEEIVDFLRIPYGTRERSGGAFIYYSVRSIMDSDLPLGIFVYI